MSHEVMIQSDKNAFYFVYPSWARFSFAWKDLKHIFTRPFETDFLQNPDYWTKIGYESGGDKFQLIEGPVGNGIIKGIGNKRASRFFWMGVLLQQANFNILPGFPNMGLDYGVRWLKEKDTDEHYFFLRKKSVTFLPRISLEYAVGLGSSIYISLAFGTRTIVDEDACLRFQMLCDVFGLQCFPALSLEGLPEVARKLISPAVSHRWFSLKTVSSDAGLLVSKLFYLACAIKHESRTFKSIHLIGAFEGEPAMAKGWKEYINQK